MTASEVLLRQARPGFKTQQSETALRWAVETTMKRRAIADAIVTATARISAPYSDPAWAFIEQREREKLSLRAGLEKLKRAGISSLSTLSIETALQKTEPHDNDSRHLRECIREELRNTAGRVFANNSEKAAMPWEASIGIIPVGETSGVTHSATLPPVDLNQLVYWAMPQISFTEKNYRRNKSFKYDHQPLKSFKAGELCDTTSPDKIANSLNWVAAHQHTEGTDRIIGGLERGENPDPLVAEAEAVHKTVTAIRSAANEFIDGALEDNDRKMGEALLAVCQLI